jgi:hypothetical protein
MRSVLGGARQCFAYNFDGIDDRGVLANRAINNEGDNTFEFWSPAETNNLQAIIAQSITGGGAEFILQSSAVGNLQVNFGASITTIFSSAQGFKPATRYGLTLIGTTAQVFEGGLSGTLVRTATFTRGAAREPAAQTLIGCRGNGAGSFAGFFSGLQYDIRINGVLWEMGNRNEAIQPSMPAGNNMTLVNTTSDRWQQVSCRV